jgi:hypothetical protein
VILPVRQNRLYLGLWRATDVVSALQATPRHLKAWECIISGLRDFVPRQPGVAAKELRLALTSMRLQL